MGANMKKPSFLAKSTSLISYQHRSKKILRLMQTTDFTPYQAENNRGIRRVKIHNKQLNLNQRQEIHCQGTVCKNFKPLRIEDTNDERRRDNRKPINTSKAGSSQRTTCNLGTLEFRNLSYSWMKILGPLVKALE